MSRDAEDWAAMSRLTGVVFDAAQFRMAQLRQREAALRDTIAAINAEMNAQTVTLDDPAHRAGAPMRWQHWVDRRRVALNGELARTLVQIEAARAGLAHAHGRHQVTETLTRDAQKAARDLRGRRMGDA